MADIKFCLIEDKEGYDEDSTICSRPEMLSKFNVFCFVFSPIQRQYVGGELGLHFQSRKHYYLYAISVLY